MKIGSCLDCDAWIVLFVCSVSSHDQNIQQRLLLSIGQEPNGTPNKGRLPGCKDRPCWFVFGHDFLFCECFFWNRLQGGLPLDAWRRLAKSTIRTAEQVCWLVVTLVLQDQCQQQQWEFPEKGWLVGFIDSIAIDGSRKDHFAILFFFLLARSRVDVRRVFLDPFLVDSREMDCRRRRSLFAVFETEGIEFLGVSLSELSKTDSISKFLAMMDGPNDLRLFDS